MHFKTGYPIVSKKKKKLDILKILSKLTFSLLSFFSWKSLNTFFSSKYLEICFRVCLCQTILEYPFQDLIFRPNFLKICCHKGTYFFSKEEKNYIY